jgi:hypothetical protein
MQSFSRILSKTDRIALLSQYMKRLLPIQIFLDRNSTVLLMAIRPLLPDGPLPTGAFEVPISNGVGPEFFATVALNARFNAMSETYNKKLTRALAVSSEVTIDFRRMTNSSNKFCDLSFTAETLAILQAGHCPPIADPSEAMSELRATKFCPICYVDFHINDIAVKKGCCQQVLHSKCEEERKRYQPEPSLKPSEKPQERDMVKLKCAFCRQDASTVAPDRVGRRTAEGWCWE